MRKSISLIICFALCLLICEGSMNETYAETVGLGSYGSDVRVKMAGKCEIVYQVDISWGDMKFVYKTGGSRVWNEKTHLYDEKYISTWSGTGDTIKIMNHSNSSIDANFTYNNKGSYTGIIGTFDSNKAMKLPSAEGKSVDAEELKGTRKLILSGVLSNTLDEYIQVGTVNISIN